ncbi:MAG: ABC transporter permease, partial [Nocardioidaceae bacterium]
MPEVNGPPQEPPAQGRHADQTPLEADAARADSPTDGAVVAEPTATPADRWGIGSVDAWLPTVKVTVASVILALVIGAVLVIVSDSQVLNSFPYFFSYPADTFRFAGDAVGSSYWALLNGSLGSWNAITNTLDQAAPLICAGLGVTLAFRAGLFNIGAQGQMIIGAACAGFVGFHFQMPIVVHLIAALVAGLVGGAVWGAIAGILKARTGAHEVIVTIMLNYTGILALQWLLTTRSFQQKNGAGNPISPSVDNSAAFPQAWGIHLG